MFYQAFVFGMGFACGVLLVTTAYYVLRSFLPPSEEQRRGEQLGCNP